MCDIKEKTNAPEITEEMIKAMTQYGENKKITDGNYDRSLAAKCINGTFVGKKTDNVISYKGIPFVGKQPVGALRWKAPVDVIPDDGVYEAYYNGKSPVQNSVFDEGATLYWQGEDCLYLDIWKADDKKAEKKPVIVWIHGGAYEAGGTAYPVTECHNLVRENPDVIVVTLAYRLSVMGFLHLSHLQDGKDYPDAQNLGIMDQMMGLKWVHENIAAFGGDPDNVTLWGESAGAGSVTLLPLVKGSQKYFKRVIAQSGSPSLSRTTEDAIECTNELMKTLGCKSVADLMKIDAKTLVDASGNLFLRIAPEKDGKYLPLDPHEAYASGTVKDIGFLQGCNKDEFDYFLAIAEKQDFEDWAAVRKAKKLAGLSKEEKERVESFCLENGDGKLFEQVWFNAGLIRMSENQTKAGGKSYTYFFTRPQHGIELTLVFAHPEMDPPEAPFDETFAKTVRKMWIQFAKTGDPSLSAEISPDGKAYEWPLYDPENKKVMVLDEKEIRPETEGKLKLVDWDRTYLMTRYGWL